MGKTKVLFVFNSGSVVKAMWMLTVSTFPGSYSWMVHYSGSGCMAQRLFSGYKRLIKGQNKNNGYLPLFKAMSSFFVEVRLFSVPIMSSAFHCKPWWMKWLQVRNCIFVSLKFCLTNLMWNIVKEFAFITILARLSTANLESIHLDKI